jgi:hypothetical protein
MVNVERRGCADHDVVVVEGLCSEAAVCHLCHTLDSGAAFDDAAGLVIDLAGVPGLSSDTVAALDEAALALEHHRRWFAVSGGPPVEVCDTLLEDHSYPSVEAAIGAAGRFYRLVEGATTAPARAATLATAVFGCADVARAMGFGVVRGAIELPFRVGTKVLACRGHSLGPRSAASTDA